MGFSLVSAVGTRAEDGFSFALFKHWTAHYLDLGFSPEHWKISLYARDLDDNMGMVADWLMERGIVPVHCIPDSPLFNPLEYDEEHHRIKAALPPNEWIIIADADEFHGFPKPVSAFFDQLDVEGYDVVRGHFVDRVAADLSLPEVMDEPSIFEQFPLETRITAKITEGLCEKACAFKNHLTTSVGHHHVYGEPRSYAPGLLKVHHFKWTKGLQGRAERHLSLKDKRYWWQQECTRLLRYLKDDRMTFTFKQIT